MAELLEIPLKKSTDVDLVKPLKNLIQSTYNSGESSEDYSDALNELSRLRTNAIWKVFEKSSLDVLYSYYDQLVSLEAKVPPHEVQVPFKWKDAFDKGSIFGGRASLTISSLAYERMCVLFNIGALQSSVAAGLPLDTEDELKQAAKLLQQSAGVFTYLKANVMMAVHQETTPDLSADVLDALAKLMLAQAQEVIAYKCMRDEMKDSMVSKVCAACEEMYADAARALARDGGRALWEREWQPAVGAKQASFRGLALYHQAAVCRAAGARGEEIARLQWAVELLRPGSSRGAVSRELGAKASRALAAAVKDNDFIYHERIPERGALEPVPRAPVAKPLAPPPAFSAGKDLFASLVPLSVRGALQAADARRADAVAALVNKLRDATQLLNSVLASLNLPACLEEGEGALPASIAEKAAAVRAAGGAAELARLMQELPDLLQRNRDILNEAARMLREEAEADAALRAQFGARWTRTPSERLTDGFLANGDKYRQIIDNAVRADNIVRDKYHLHKEGIDLLSRSEAELCAGVPDAPHAPDAAPAAPRARHDLLQLMREVEALKAMRDALEAELKEVRVELRAVFLEAAARGALDEPALALPALHAALQPLQARLDASLQAQDRLQARLQEGVAALPAGARGARDEALRRLAAAHDAFQELTANLTEGVKFYNDLTQLLVAYQNKVSDFCFARRTEKEELLKDLTQEASRPAPAAPSPAAPAPALEPTAVKRSPPPRPPPPAAAPSPAAPSPAAPAAALPYPAQPQGMPLPYGAGVAGVAGVAGAYGYYAAPMPALYNPYATLPYPHHAPRMPPAAPYQPYQYPPPAPAPLQPHQAHQPPPPGYNPYQQQ